MTEEAMPNEATPEERAGKEVVAKDDGRYIIFFSFEEDGDDGEAS